MYLGTSCVVISQDRAANVSRSTQLRFKFFQIKNVTDPLKWLHLLILLSFYFINLCGHDFTEFMMCNA